MTKYNVPLIFSQKKYMKTIINADQIRKYETFCGSAVWYVSEIGTL